MKRRYILYRRKRGGMFYIEDTETRKQESTGTRNRAEATSLLNARNESIRQPHLNLQIANATGNSVSLKTRVKAEAVQKVNAMNETERQPGISLGLARVYLNATDPKLATRTWQDVMENIVAKKTDETRRRWETAIKDKNFDCLRKL